MIGQWLGRLFGQGNPAPPVQHKPPVTRAIDTSVTEDGLLFSFEVDRSQGRLVALHLLDGDAFLPSRYHFFTDDDGDCRVVVETDEGISTAQMFVPWGAVDHADPKVNVRLTQLAETIEDRFSPKAVSWFEVDWQNRPQAMAGYWRPLIELCMVVAHADGRIDPAEEHMLRQLLADQLELGLDQKAVVQEMVSKTPTKTAVELVREVRLRAPFFDIDTILGIMVEMAQADGVVDPSELALIRSVYETYKTDLTGWDAFEADAVKDNPPASNA